MWPFSYIFDKFSFLSQNRNIELVITRVLIVLVFQKYNIIN